MTRATSVVVALLLLGTLASAATLEVGPGRAYAGIQQAIDAATGGDTINVYGTGTYAGRLAFGGKNITVTSMGAPEDYVIDGELGGAAVTISGTAKISGFTIRRGRANYGSGVNVTGGTPEISYNIIQDNENTGSTRGGGVYTETGAWIHHTTITHNAAWSAGGIFCSGGALLEYNTISDNTASGTGGGVRTSNTNGAPTLRHNTSQATTPPPRAASTSTKPAPPTGMSSTTTGHRLTAAASMPSCAGPASTATQSTATARTPQAAGCASTPTTPLSPWPTTLSQATTPTGYTRKSKPCQERLSSGTAISTTTVALITSRLLQTRPARTEAYRLIRCLPRPRKVTSTSAPRAADGSPR